MFRQHEVKSSFMQRRKQRRPGGLVHDICYLIRFYPADYPITSEAHQRHNSSAQYAIGHSRTASWHRMAHNSFDWLFAGSIDVGSHCPFPWFPAVLRLLDGAILISL